MVRIGVVMQDARVSRDCINGNMSWMENMPPRWYLVNLSRWATNEWYQILWLLVPEFLSSHNSPTGNLPNKFTVVGEADPTAFEVNPTGQCYRTSSYHWALNATQVGRTFAHGQDQSGPQHFPLPTRSGTNGHTL